VTAAGPPPQAYLVVLVRLRPGTDRDEYERFTAEVDRPGVLAHYPSVADWHLYRVRDAGAGVDYVEVATVRDAARLREDMSTPAARELVARARRYIEPPVALVLDRVG
jgi:hypothetical protein